MLVNNSQRILLELLIGDENQAAYQWNKWVDESNWLEKPIDWSSFQLLSNVYYQLPKENSNLIGLSRLKGVYKRVWYENSQLFHQARIAFSDLRDAGLPIMLLDNAALTLTLDLDRGTLPIKVVHFAVPESKTNEALLLLLDRGWHYQKMGNPLSDKAKCFYAFELVNSEGGRIRLYRYLRPENQKQGDDLSVWKRALSTDFDGIEVFAPTPTDAFLLTLLNGWQRLKNPSVAWIWESHILLEGKSSSIDWDFMAIEAQRRRITLRIQSALNYLRKSWDFGIPLAIINHFSQISPSQFEVWEERILMSKSPFLIELIRRALSNYFRKKGDPTSLHWWLGLVKYLYCLINPPSGLKAVPWIFSRIWNNIFAY